MRVEQSGSGAGEPVLAFDVQVGYIWMPRGCGEDAVPRPGCRLHAEDSVVGSGNQLVVRILRQREYIVAVEPFVDH